MSHGIDSIYDVVYSTVGTEWHGLAKPVETIGETEKNVVNFKIHQAEDICVMIDGILVKIESHKVLVADLRHREEEFQLLEAKTGERANRLMPLHIPKNSYSIIENKEVVDAMEGCVQELGAKVVSMGTLECLKKFFISVDIGDSDIVINNRGIEEKTCAYLDFITSHDGELAMTVYDSMTRIVCMNTLRASLATAGNLGFKCYHSSGSKFQMQKLPELFQAIVKDRRQYQETCHYLIDLDISKDDALYASLGYLTTPMEKNDKVALKSVSTQAINAAESIADLFKTGQGNLGKSRYDCFCGATEHWTSGEGTGKNSSKIEKMYKSKFGQAAMHKENFLKVLCLPEEKFQEVVERGKSNYSLYHAAKS